MVLGGILLLMVVTFNGNLTGSAALQRFHSNVQTNLTTVTGIVENDFRLLGYEQISGNDPYRITFADTSKIVFKEDYDANGTVDSISYYLGTTTPPGVVNKSARILYRKVNTGAAQEINAGVTRFRMWYYDAKDSVTTIPANIRTIKIAVNVESPQPILRNRTKAMLSSSSNDSTYSGAYWERTITPKNLNLR